jgi:hypothetical protein
LIKSGHAVHEPIVTDALAWLTHSRRGAGAWGFRRNSKSEITPTCFALLAFLEAYRSDRTRDVKVIEAGVKYLVTKFHREEGSFGDDGRLEAAHTLLAVLVLQAARRCDIAVHLEHENAALDWLLDHPDDAVAPAEETIQIDPDRKRQRFDYGYLFMTDTFLIRALMGSVDQAKRSSELAQRTLLSLRQRWDNETGGFYGPRVFTWSTAKALCALNTATAHYQEFPTTAPGSATGAKATLATLLPVIFAVVFLVALIVLSIAKALTLFAAIILLILVIAFLTYAKVLNQKTFKDLFIAVIALAKSSPKSAKKRDD